MLRFLVSKIVSSSEVFQSEFCMYFPFHKCVLHDPPISLFFIYRVQNGSGAHPSSYPLGTRGSVPGSKDAREETDHLPPSSAESKNAWSYASTPPIGLHGVVLSLKKAQGQLFFTNNISVRSTSYKVSRYAIFPISLLLPLLS
jgi:hypothetical protein